MPQARKDGAAINEEEQTTAPASEEDEFEVGHVEPPEDEGGKSRAEKKRERGEVIARNEALQEENQRLIQSQNAILEEIRAMRQQPPAPAQTAPASDPDKPELDAIYREQRALILEQQAYGNAITAEQQSDLEARARELEQRKFRLAARKEIRESGIGRPSTPGQEQVQALRMRHHDVISNPRAKMFAEGQYNILKADRFPNRAPTESEEVALIEESMQMARSKYGMGGGQPAGPPRATRSKYAAVGRGGASGGNAPREKFVMNEKTNRLADRAFPHIKDTRARRQKWVNECSADYVAEMKNAKNNA